MLFVHFVERRVVYLVWRTALCPRVRQHWRTSVGNVSAVRYYYK